MFPNSQLYEAPSTEVNAHFRGITTINVKDLNKCEDALSEARVACNMSLVNKLDNAHRPKAAAGILRNVLSASRLDDLLRFSNSSGRYFIFRANEDIPYDGDRETIVSFQMGFMELSGARPFGYTEGAGDVRRIVRPVTGDENNISTTGRRSFGPHTDHAWARFSWEPDDCCPLAPDFLSLAGVYNPHQVGTRFAAPTDILFQLDEATQYALEQPEWSFPAPPSVKPTRLALKLPIVSRRPDRKAVIRLNPRIICETERAEGALAKLKDVLETSSVWTEIVLQPGDIVLAHGTALHMRAEVNGERELIGVYGRDKSLKPRLAAEACPYLETLH
ncbi:MAG: hypothetical protein AAFR90_13720 [Pseudomonadota bacterium]